MHPERRSSLLASSDAGVEGVPASATSRLGAKVRAHHVPLGQAGSLHTADGAVERGAASLAMILACWGHHAPSRRFARRAEFRGTARRRVTSSRRHAVTGWSSTPRSCIGGWSTSSCSRSGRPSPGGSSTPPAVARRELHRHRMEFEPGEAFTRRASRRLADDANLGDGDGRKGRKKSVPSERVGELRPRRQCLAMDRGLVFHHGLFR